MRFIYGRGYIGIAEVLDVSEVGRFFHGTQDHFNPEYGGIIWKRRLNAALEDAEAEIEPVVYQRGNWPPMQITQENTMLFVNAIADEMDCIGILYAPAEEQDWIFREDFDDDERDFDVIASHVGQWALCTTTLYPMANVVAEYERRYDVEIPDELPDGFGEEKEDG